MTGAMAAVHPAHGRRARAPLTAVLVVVFVVATPASASAQYDAQRVLLVEAESAYGDGDLAKAAKLYDRAIAESPRAIDAAAYAKRASIFLQHKKYRDALAWIEKIAEVYHPDNPLILEQKAVVLYSLPGRKRDAVRVAEKVVASRPDAYGLHLMIGDYYASGRERSPAKTVAAYQAFLRSRPARFASADRTLYVKLGFAQLALDAHGEADAAFRRALSLGAGAGLARKARAGRCESLVGGKKWRAALQLCQQAATDDRRAGRTATQSALRLGTAQMHMRRLDAAEKTAAAYLRAAPRDPEGYLLLGEVYCKKKDFRRAEALFRKAKAIAPDSVQARVKLGRLLLDGPDARPQLAVEELSAALAASRRDSRIAYALARAYLSSGQPQRAIELAEVVLRLEPDLPVARSYALALRGDAGLAAGRSPEDALEDYTASLALDGKRRRARRGAGRVLERMAVANIQGGRLDRAASQLARSLEYWPSSTTALTNLGVVHIAREDWPHAVAVLSRAEARAKDDALVARLLARALVGKGDLDRAETTYGRAHEAAAKQPELRTEISAEWGVLALSRGDAPAAVDRLEEALQLGKGSAYGALASRHLGRAMCRRGMDAAAKGRWVQAVRDLKASLDDDKQLPQPEIGPCRFTLALGYVAIDRAAVGKRIFADLHDDRSWRGWWKESLPSAGPGYFHLFAAYAEGTVASLREAERIGRRLVGETRGEERAAIVTVVRAALEQLGYLYARANRTGPAREALGKAARLASGRDQRVIENNLAVLALRAGQLRGARRQLAALGDTPTEALINLGLVHERLGEFDKAYQYWLRARARGAKDAELTQWIKAKEQLFGYGE